MSYQNVVIVLRCDGWTEERRPTAACVPCREAVAAGAGEVLQTYIAHPAPSHETPAR